MKSRLPLKAGNQLHFRYTKGQPDTEMKRAIICGKDHPIHSRSDLLEGLSNKDIAEITQTTPLRGTAVGWRSCANPARARVGPGGCPGRNGKCSQRQEYK